MMRLVRLECYQRIKKSIGMSQWMIKLRPQAGLTVISILLLKQSTRVADACYACSLLQNLALYSKNGA